MIEDEEQLKKKQDRNHGMRKNNNDAPSSRILRVDQDRS